MDEITNNEGRFTKLLRERWFWIAFFIFSYSFAAWGLTLFGPYRQWGDAVIFVALIPPLLSFLTSSISLKKGLQTMTALSLFIIILQIFFQGMEYVIVVALGFLIIPASFQIGLGIPENYNWTYYCAGYWAEICAGREPAIFLYWGTIFVLLGFATIGSHKLSNKWLKIIFIVLLLTLLISFKGFFTTVR